MMAHGNNRTSQMQRFRQRFMHKLVYYPLNNDGMFSCVGMWPLRGEMSGIFKYRKSHQGL